MKAALASLVLFISFSGLTQKRCLTDDVMASGAKHVDLNELHHWIDKLQTERHQMGLSKNASDEVLNIPVVFHIIHNGEIIGQGRNIAQSKIEEQLDILNEDFARLNADRINTPDIYDDVVADIGIQFSFAKQDPYGLPTDAIVRVRGSKSSYSPESRAGSADDQLLKAESHWPSEDYFNIYVADLSNGLGYAQFPFTNLDGLENELFNYDLTDGVVVDYKWLGVNLETGGSFDSYGRTLTHETGHFFGLLHIWGLSFSCTSDDYCEDTPLQSSSTSGCGITTSCTTEDMIQNYMDYTDDVCMNAFTEDQKSRMRTVALNSPRRKSLLTSPALLLPTSYTFDLGLKSIIEAQTNPCSSIYSPTAELINYGNTPQEDIVIKLYLDEVEIQEITYPSIPSLVRETISFDAIELETDRNYEFRLSIDNNDENTSNNDLIISKINAEGLLVPFNNDFETGVLSLARLDNSQWNVVTATDSTATNKSAVLPFYNNSENFGVNDYLITDALDVSAITSAELTFSYAYASRNDGQFNDGFIVGILEGCEKTLDFDNYIFELYGSRLASAGTKNDEFKPSSPAEWERVALNITPYLSSGTIQVVFIGVNGGGNNLYLDNIAVNSADLNALDLGIRNVDGISPTTCVNEIFPIVEFKNFGYEKIESLDLILHVNDRTFSESSNTLNIFSGQSQLYNLSIRSLQEGQNLITLTIDKINGVQDQGNSNNSVSYSVFVDYEEDVVPVRESFEQTKWVLNAIDSAPGFEVTDVNSKKVAQSIIYNSTLVGGSSYIVSPTIKTNNQKEGAIRIKYSYASRNGYNDQLRVSLSPDCGRNYSLPIYAGNSEDFAVRKSEEEWVPETDEDWSELFIDITEHMIWQELRVMVDFQNGGGNNLYIDDIEFLTDNDPDQPVFDTRVTVFPNPADGEFFVNINIPVKETINMQLIDMAGNIVFDSNFPNSLNQTYRMIAPSQSGFYLLRVTGEQIKQTKRLYIQP